MRDIISVPQLRAARAMLGLKQFMLAKMAGISTGTLNNIERGMQTNPKINTVAAIQKALEQEGIEFLFQGAENVGVRMRSAHDVETEQAILIIDDCYADRKLYKAWLKQDKALKYRMLEAGSAKDGYEALMEERPGCLILDFMMAGKNGLQFLVEIKKRNIIPPPTIFVTGVLDTILKRDILALGVNAYLEKSTLSKDKLCEAVANFLPLNKRWA